MAQTLNNFGFLRCDSWVITEQTLSHSSREHGNQLHLFLPKTHFYITPICIPLQHLKCLYYSKESFKNFSKNSLIWNVYRLMMKSCLPKVLIQKAVSGIISEWMPVGLQNGFYLALISPWLRANKCWWNKICRNH